MILHQAIFWGLLLLTCGYATWRGGMPERIAAVSFLLAAAFTTIVASPRSEVIGGVEWSVFGVDFGLFLALSVVALMSCRYWPMLMASFQGCELLGHLAKGMAPDIVAIVYFAIVSLLSWPMVLLLAIATWRHRKRLRYYGVDYAWVGDLPPAYRAGWVIDERQLAQTKIA